MLTFALAHVHRTLRTSTRFLYRESRLTAIAIDGKWLRGVLDGQVKLFAAMLHEEKVIIAQHRIPDETTQVRALLDAVDLDNAVVTADAVHHQRQERLRARSPLPRPGDLIRRQGDIGVACPGTSPGGMMLAPRARQAFLECFAGPAA